MRSSLVARRRGLILLALFGCPLASVAAMFSDLPEKIDSSQPWLFHLHGQIIEEMGPDNALSAEFGRYDYRAIVKKLSDAGYSVISEARPKNTDMNEYAEKVAGQVRKLIAAGVPPSHITVTGFSKGGMIALLACARIANPSVNYVFAAACPQRPVPALQRAGAGLQGRALSLVDYRDRICGSCKEMFALSKSGLRTREIIYHDGAGHGLFYKPGPWIDDLTGWPRKIQEE